MSDQLTKFGLANYLPTITYCAYCSEEIPKTQKYCSQCRTQGGRKEIFEENSRIIIENTKKGFQTSKTLRSWK